jgi:hypothetical protein
MDHIRGELLDRDAENVQTLVGGSGPGTTTLSRVEENLSADDPEVIARS